MKKVIFLFLSLFIISCKVEAEKKDVAIEIKESVEYFSKVFELDKEFIYSVIETESEFKINAKSRAGEQFGRGLMQISEIALKEFNIKTNSNVDANELYKINTNIMIGCWYLNRIKNVYLKNKYNSWTSIYIAYNVGPVYFINNVDNLYCGLYNNTVYNAGKRFSRISKKYRS